MGKRIQKLKAKQPRAIRLNKRECVKRYRQMLEAAKSDDFLKYHSEVSINGNCVSSSLGFIVGFGGTHIQQIVPIPNNKSKDLEISFEAKPIPENPVIDKITKNILDELDRIM